MASEATEDRPASFEGTVFGTSGMGGTGTDIGCCFSMVVVCGCSLVRCAAMPVGNTRKGCGCEGEEEEEAGRWASRRGRRRRVG